MANFMARLAAIGVALGCASAIAQVSVTDPNSKHNLSTSGPSGAQSGTNEVCVFCHTPHGANLNVDAPLWNRNTNTQTGYTRYSDTQSGTLDGAEAPVGSVSLACLSCHDGSQSRDVVINAPGSGDGGGAPIGGGTLGPIPAGSTNFGTDLTNDHPISIEYAGGACRNLDAGASGAPPVECDPNTAASGDPDFNPALATTINNVPQWWVDVGTFPTGLTDAGGAAITGTGQAGVREKTDMLLYYRTDFNVTDGAGNPVATTGPSVECGSCHDPHDATERPLQFLRISNDTSAVCLACHIK